MLSDQTDAKTKSSTNESSTDLMARKRTRRITFEMSAKKHGLVKMAALQEDRLAKDVLNEAVDEWLAKHGYT